VSAGNLFDTAPALRGGASIASRHFTMMVHRSALLWFSLVTMLLLACGGKGSGKSDTERPTYSITQKTAKKLQAVREHADKKDWDGALAELAEIEESKYLNPYEHAAIHAARAGIYAAQEKLDETAKSLAEAVALDAMPMEAQQDTTYNLGQTYFMLERFSEAADTFAKWEEREEKPKPEQLYVIASSFAQAKRFKEALPRAERAVSETPKPSEEMLRFMVSLYYELDQQQDVAKSLEKLTELYPKNKEWWLQLAATYDALEQPDRALSALQGAYDKGLLTEEKPILALAQAYMRSGKPAVGAELIEKHLDDGVVSKGEASALILAQAWIAAKDVKKAHAALDTAGDGLTSGEPYVALAWLEIDRSQWAAARDALVSAFEKGGLKSPGVAHLMLGVAHYHTKRKDAALASLGEAKKHRESRGCAEEWMATVRAGKGSGPSCLKVRKTKDEPDEE
jgi:tetratricopeptide (TPR) repeat protein